MAKTKQILPPLENARYYKDTLCLAVPLLCLPCYFYGIRPAVLCLVAVLVANVCDRVVAFLRGRIYDEADYSSESFAVLIALLMPASIEWYILIVAVLACVLLGKEAFGGYGSYPFHPTAVGYAVAAISWPAQMFRYPQVFTKLPLIITQEISYTTSMSSILKHGGLPIVSDFDLYMGNYVGAVGTTSALILATCALLLWARRDINFATVFSFLFVCAAIVFLFPRQDGLTGPILETIDARLAVVKYEMLSGMTIFGAILLICEPYTCPKHWVSRIAFGGILGVVAMMFRYEGVYETGLCFALLLVSVASGWLDRSIMAWWSGIIAKRAIKKQQKGGSAV